MGMKGRPRLGDCVDPLRAAGPWYPEHSGWGTVHRLSALSSRPLGWGAGSHMSAAVQLPAVQIHQQENWDVSALHLPPKGSDSGSRDAGGAGQPGAHFLPVLSEKPALSEVL